MTRALQLGGLLLVCGAVYAADQKAAPKAPPAAAGAGRPANPPPRNAAPNAGRGGAVNRPGGGRQMGAPIINPANPATRLFKATPEERERALEKLPPAMQDQFRAQFRRFDALSPAQQQLQLKWVDRYSALTSQQQISFRQRLQELQRLAPDQRKPIAMALRRLEGMSDEQRQKVLDSEEFKSRFSADELKMISDLSVVMLPPM